MGFECSLPWTPNYSFNPSPGQSYTCTNHAHTYCFALCLESSFGSTLARICVGEYGFGMDTKFNQSYERWVSLLSCPCTQTEGQRLDNEFVLRLCLTHNLETSESFMNVNLTRTYSTNVDLNARLTSYSHSYLNEGDFNFEWGESLCPSPSIYLSIHLTEPYPSLPIPN
jgi:hypothetical protein